MMTDPIADMLTRIRNANAMKKKTVNIPLSRVKKEILEVLRVEGYIEGYQVKRDEKSHHSVIEVTLKYLSNNARVIQGLKRISKPGLRVYAGNEDLPKVLNGLGTAVISTSKGIMTDKDARKQKVGGEVIAYVW
ncbi:MAG: 30S ribosomal protein S8 [Bacillales bacterium]|nr:30S ribosomal protein S8 [Bacillales bacterium]